MAPCLMVEPRRMGTSACPISNPKGVTLLSEEGEEGSHSSAAKLWHLGGAFHRVPSHVCLMVDRRVIPAERMGIHHTLSMELGSSLQTVT